MCDALHMIGLVVNPMLRLVKFPFCYIPRLLTRQRLTNILRIFILYGTTLMCLYVKSQYLPYSYFYRSFSAKEPNYERVKDVNNQRQYKAQKVLSELDAKSTHAMYLKNGQSRQLRYAIGVVTVARKVHRDNIGPLEYLTQVMTQLHHVIAKYHPTDTVFPFMCNVDNNPNSHQEALYLGNYFPNVTKIYSTLYKQSKTYGSDGVKEREKQDYVFCLEAAMQYKADYVILMEDDSYPNDDFYQVLEHIIKTKLETKIERGERLENNERWGWVKLMIPYSLTKYHRNWFFFYQWIALAFFTSGICCLVFEIYIKCMTTPHSSDNSKTCLSIMCNTSSTFALVFAFTYFLWIIWMIGRPYYIQMRTFSSPHLYALEPGTSCCTQAVLYRPEEIPGIVDYLRKTICSPSLPLDFALDEYREAVKMKQYLVSPNIFSHIGFYSSIRQAFNQNLADFV